MFNPDGGAALVLARGFAVAFLLSVSGTVTFRVFVARRAYLPMTPDLAARIDTLLGRWTQVSAILGLIGLAAWTANVTYSLASPQSLGDWVSGAEAVLGGTTFGYAVLIEAALVAATGLVLGWRGSETQWRAGFVLGNAAVIAEVAHSHAFAMANGLLEITQALHLWAAAAWLGGLVPLLMIVVLATPCASATAARWFSPLGKICVGLLAATSLAQGWVLIATVKALFHSAYGWTAWMKAGLFAVLLGFAVLNRYRLAPALRGDDPAQARRRFIVSLVLQTGLGLLIVLAAALLSQLKPGMDMGMTG